MSELIVGKLLDTLDALLVEEFHIVAGIAIEEVVSAHTEPEEMDFLIRVSSIIIDILDVCRRERTVAAEIRELVEVCQTVKQSLITTAREAADSTVIRIVDSTVVLLDIRHQIVDKVLTEDIAAKTCLRSTARGSCATSCRSTSRNGNTSHQFRRVAIRQHDNHLLRQFVGNEVIENVVYASHLIIYFLSISGTADKIEYRILLLAVLHIARRQVDDGIVRAAKTLRIVVHVLHTAVRHGTDVVWQRAVGTLNLQKAVLETLVGEVLRVLGIHDADTVNDVAIGIHVGSNGTKRHRPHSVSAAGHLFATGKLYVDRHLTGRIVLVLECNHAIVRHGLCTCA